MSDHSEKACVDCHFFQKKYGATRHAPDGWSFSAESHEREKARNGNFDWVNERSGMCLHCHRDYWDEGAGASRNDEQRFERVVETDREGCDFVKYKKGMLNAAAERKVERRREKEGWWERVKIAVYGSVAGRVVAFIIFSGLALISDWLLKRFSGLGILAWFQRAQEWLLGSG